MTDYSLINKLNSIILSALNVQQKKLVDKIMQHNKKEIYSSYDHMFGVGNKRIYLNDIIKVDRDYIIDRYIHDNEHKDSTIVEYTKIVIKFLFKYLNKKSDNIDLTTTEYYLGKIKIDNREYNIGKLLNQIKNNKNNILEFFNNYYQNIYNELANKNPENAIMAIPEEIREIENWISLIRRIDYIIKNFNSRFNINSIKDMELKIVISRDPYDIAGMSTNRRWISCMTMKGDKKNPEGGGFREYLFGDLSTGTLIAYLVDKDDNDINDPYARVLIKPFINKNEQIFLSPEERVYYDENYLNRKYTTEFLEIIASWAEEQQKEIEGIFYAHPNLYHDGKFYVNKKNKNKDIPEVNLSDVIYSSINWNKTLPNNGTKVYRYFISSEYVMKVNEFINRWNSTFKNRLFLDIDFVYIIDSSLMSLEDYKDLNFHVRVKQNKTRIKRNIYLDTKSIKTVNIRELREIIETTEPKTTSSINDIDFLLRLMNEFEQLDRLDLESYDLILVRKNKENESNNDISFDDFSDYIFDSMYIRDDESGHKKYPLFYAYLVSSGITDFKNKALLEIDISLSINDHEILNYNDESLSDMFDFSNFNDIMERELIHFYVEKINIETNFLEYIQENESKLFDEQGLVDEIFGIIDDITIYCNDEIVTNAIENFLDPSIYESDDLEYYYDKYNIDDNSDNNTNTYYDLEELISD